MNVQRHTIYIGEPSERTLCAVGDLNGDGRPEAVIGARRPRGELYWLGRSPTGAWERHTMDTACGPLEAGGVLADISGNGRLDFVAAHDSQSDLVLWWEQPADPSEPWTRRVVFQMPARQSHDQCVADLDRDGRAELAFWNQGSGTLFWVRLPDDPRRSPWPGVQPVATGLGNEEGFAVADVDGDGHPELIAGQSWYRWLPGDRWERHRYTAGYVSTRLAAADFDGDGQVEIVLAEGDASFQRPCDPFGRLVLFKPTSDVAAPWEAHPLLGHLADPHSLAVADFDGDGLPDVFVGELGSPNGDHPHPPAQRVLLNRGGGCFTEHVVDVGIGTHEAKATTLDGRPAIIGKPYRNLASPFPRGPDVDAVHLWVWRSE